MPAKKSKKKSRHVLAYLRESIGSTQSRLAGLAGVVTETIKSIELQRLPSLKKSPFGSSNKPELTQSGFWITNLANRHRTARKCDRHLMKHARAPGEISTWHT